MNIDLTKPIEVKLLPQQTDLTCQYEVSEVGDEAERAILFGQVRQEAYRRLFEAAPKMLAMLKEIYGVVEACHNCIQSEGEGLDARYLALIAEIEGEEIKEKDAVDSALTENGENAAPFAEIVNFRVEERTHGRPKEDEVVIEGGWYDEAANIEISDDGKQATIIYKSGKVATGPIEKDGPRREEFFRERDKWLAYHKDMMNFAWSKPARRRMIVRPREIFSSGGQQFHDMETGREFAVLKTVDSFATIRFYGSFEESQIEIVDLLDEARFVQIGDLYGELRPAPEWVEEGDTTAKIADLVVNGSAQWTPEEVNQITNELKEFDIVRKALRFGAAKHIGQRRKYTFEPYFNHCVAVAEIVAEVTDDQNMIAAALLHDTIEDTGTRYDELCSAFNVDVAELVNWLSDDSTPTYRNRAARKKIDRDFLALAPARAQTIKLADLIDNTSSIVEHDPGFARVYLAEKEALLHVLTRGDSRLLDRAWGTLRSAKLKLGIAKEVGVEGGHG